MKRTLIQLTLVLIAALLSVGSSSIWPGNRKKQSTRSGSLYKQRRETGCSDEDSSRCLTLGNSYYKKGRYREALDYFKIGCKDRKAVCCRHMGHMLKKRLGVRTGGRRGIRHFRLTAAALTFYRRACEYDDGIGCIRAGEMLREGGPAVRRNERLAMKYFRKGCSLQDANSNFCRTIRAEEQVEATASANKCVGEYVRKAHRLASKSLFWFFRYYSYPYRGICSAHTQKDNPAIERIIQETQAEVLEVAKKVCLKLPARTIRRGLYSIFEHLNRCVSGLRKHPETVKELRAIGNQYWKSVWRQCRRLSFPRTGLKRIFAARGSHNTCKQALRFFGNKRVAVRLYLLYSRRLRILRARYKALKKRKFMVAYNRAIARNNRAHYRSHSPATYVCHWKCCAFGCSKPRGYATVVAKSSTDAWSKVKRVFNFSTFFTCKNQYGRTGTPTIRCRRR